MAEDIIIIIIIIIFSPWPHHPSGWLEHHLQLLRPKTFLPSESAAMQPLLLVISNQQNPLRELGSIQVKFYSSICKSNSKNQLLTLVGESVAPSQRNHGRSCQTWTCASEFNFENIFTAWWLGLGHPTASPPEFEKTR